MADTNESKDAWMGKGMKMYRVVFCPEDKTVDDAFALAKEWGLPIQHGDSERSLGMNFDRSQIQVLSIPIDRGFDSDHFEFSVIKPVSIKYSNDWDDISTYTFILRPYGMKTGKTAWNIPSMKMDTHRAVMNIAVSFPGKYEIVAVKDGVERDSAVVTTLGHEEGVS